MTEFKAQLNMRMTPDANVSFTFTRIVDGPLEAQDFGAHCCALATAWCQGYDSEREESEESA